MITFLRWFGRFLFLLGVLGLLVCGAVLASFNSWKSEKLRELAAGSEIATVDPGNIEFAIRGTGQPVLVLHGAPGGYDQALLLGEQLVAAGFQVIAPSRPGFLRTPLTTGLTTEAQADAMALLLQNQGIEKVAVVAFSTGGPVGVQFALRHPRMTAGLALVSSYTSPFTMAPERRFFGESVMLRATGDIGSWYLVELAGRDPGKLLGWAFGGDSTLDESARAKLVSEVLGNPAQLEWFRRLVGTQAPLSPREAGTRNDAIMVRTLWEIPYGEIKAPVLFVYGTADADGESVNPKVIQEAIPAARIYAVEGAGHLVWLGPGAAAMSKELTKFVGDSFLPPVIP